MLDAYIIEEIKKRDEARRRGDDTSRPRLHIEIPVWPNRDRGTEEEAPEDPHAPPVDEHEDEDDSDGAVRIDL
jgi:hypothetical protein